MLLSIILLLIIIIGIIAIFYAITYNNLINYKLRIEKAEGIIDESLRKKYDILSKLNISIKKIAPKKDYLKEYIDLKDKRISNYEMDRKLTEAYNIILDVKEDNSSLDTKEFKKNLKEIEEINETLTSCKNYYNKNTTEVNKILQKFPSNIVGKIHGFKIKPFFDGKNMQDSIIDDFKL
jgi:LemA protein